jgi:hypothetical protein
MGTKVIYHGNCNDGFCAAWVAWLKFGDKAEYISANYGDEPPPVDSEDILYIVDFSYPRDILLKLHGTGRSRGSRLLHLRHGAERSHAGVGVFSPR